MTLPQYEWTFRQVFGDTCQVEQVQDADMISALKFNADGSFLAAGDRGGRVIIFQRKTQPDGSTLPVEYEFYTEFSAHQTGFDALRSVQILERVVQLQWLPPIGDQLYLLTCNERMVKIWRISERQAVQVSNTNLQRGRRGGDQLMVPRVAHVGERQPQAQCRRTFDNVTPWKINSISASVEADRFLIADDLRVSIWSTDSVHEGMEVVALQPPRQDEACEVVTYASFVPGSGSQFVYGTSSGAVQLVDTRVAPTGHAARSFQNPLVSSQDLPYNTFGAAANQADIAAGICAVALSAPLHQLVARDFLSCRVWDVRMENRPLQVIPLHPQVRDYCGRFLESDAIFDRFELAFAPGGRSFITGGYTDRFCVYSCRDGGLYSGYNIQATRQVKRRARQVATHLGGRPSPSPAVGALPVLDDGKLLADNLQMDPMEVRRKIQFLDWHPAENVLAIATVSNLYVYASAK